MTIEKFYQHLENHISPLQTLASHLSNDFETARYLYLETTFMAFQAKDQLRPDNMGAWLKSAMRKTFKKVA